MEKELKEIVDNFKDKKILVIGDVMLDISILGHVKRISPEAPVPVLKEESREYMLGGAANVAANIASLSGKPTLLGFIGQDSEGEKLIELAQEAGIVFFPTYEGDTIVKTRPISIDHQAQQLLRIDREKNEPKYFEKKLILQKAEEAELIVVSDYAKGAVTPELMKTLLQSGKKIIVDPKPENNTLYKGSLYEKVFLITPNEDEALKLSGCTNIIKAGEYLKQKLSTTAVIVTRGGRGMLLFSNGIREIPTNPKKIFDETGAGDTANAALALALAAGSSLEQAPILANHAAGIAVSHPGTYRVKLSELKGELFQESGKIKTLEELKKIIQNYKEQKRTVVWTNGCFDILHQGHISYLRSARAAGDCLIVGLNSDSSVKKLKGEARPIQSEQERAEILSALEFVDYVLIFPETSVEKYLLELKPDIYVKGEDYSLEKMNQEERAAFESYGGKAIFVPLVKGKSTTEIINKAKSF